MFDPEVTLYSHWNDTDNPHYRPLSYVLDRIRTGKIKTSIEQIRSTPTKQDRDTLKRNLPAAIFAGKCGKRSDNNMLEYSGLVVLDFDNVPQDFRQELQGNPYTYACWLSPSGTGFKALVRIADGTRLRDHFRHIEKHLWPANGDNPGVDPSGKNPSRLCFDSYDPELYLNPEASIYSLVLEEKVFTYVEKKAPTGSDFDKLIRWLDKKGDTYSAGNRNNFIFKIAGACCRYGIMEDEVINLIGQQWPPSGDFPVREMKTTIRSAFKKNASAFNTASFDQDELISRTGEKEIDLGLMEDGRVGDVIYADDVIEDSLRLKNVGYEKAEDWGCPEMDFKHKRGYLTIVGGYGNVGKSALMNWMQLCKTLHSGTKWAVFGPEAYPADEYYHEIVEMLEGSQLGPKTPYSINDEQYRLRHKWVGQHFFYCYPKDKIPTLDIILARFLQLVMIEGVSGVVIDPWNQLGHNYEGGSDYNLLSEGLAKCARFAQQNNVFFYILAHPKNPEIPKGHTDYRCPEYSDLAGGSMWQAKSDNILMYHRPEFISNPSSTLCQVHKKKVKKAAVIGRRGSVNMDYDWVRKRYTFGDRDPLEDLLKVHPIWGSKQTALQPDAIIVQPIRPDNPRAGITSNYLSLNGYQPDREMPGEDFWKQSND